MRWYVARDGKADGPFDDAEFAVAIRSGVVTRGDLIREQGEKEWMAVEKHSQLASHLPTRGSAASHRVPWSAMAAIAGTLTLIAATAVIYLQMRTHDALLARIDNVTRHVDSVLSEIRDVNAPTPWAPSGEVHHNCLSVRSDVTCTFTNLTEKPVYTCVRGLLAQKVAPGVKLESLILCTGKLDPGETRSVTGPWLGGFADDICFKQNDFGKSLDWSKCDFNSEPVDLPTRRIVGAVTDAK